MSGSLNSYELKVPNEGGVEYKLAEENQVLVAKIDASKAVAAVFDRKCFSLRGLFVAGVNDKNCMTSAEERTIRSNLETFLDEFQGAENPAAYLGWVMYSHGIDKGGSPATGDLVLIGDYYYNPVSKLLGGVIMDEYGLTMLPDWDDCIIPVGSQSSGRQSSERLKQSDPYRFVASKTVVLRPTSVRTQERFGDGTVVHDRYRPAGFQDFLFSEWDQLIAERAEESKIQ